MSAEIGRPGIVQSKSFEFGKVLGKEFGINKELNDWLEKEKITKERIVHILQSQSADGRYNEYYKVVITVFYV